MFRLFRFHVQEHGIQSILDRINWVSTSPAQVYAAVLGRFPESLELAIPPNDYSARDAFESTLNSTEFQEMLIPLIAAAFPEKRRLIFIHIPRTAGTDLEGNLERKYPHIHYRVTVPRDASKAVLFDRLRDFAQNIDYFDEIFFSGHIQLKWYLDNKICRATDRIFTIIRDPIDILISWVNYVVTVLSEITTDDRPDRIEWLKRLGLREIPESIDDDYRRDLAQRVLRTDSIVGSNWLCSYLGGGTSESALESLALCGVEITHIHNYAAWLRSNWNLETSTHLMQSSSILSKHSITREDYDYLHEITKEDQVLYAQVMKVLAATGKLSVNGLDVAIANRS